MAQGVLSFGAPALSPHQSYAQIMSSLDQVYYLVYHSADSFSGAVVSAQGLLLPMQIPLLAGKLVLFKLKLASLGPVFSPSAQRSAPCLRDCHVRPHLLRESNFDRFVFFVPTTRLEDRIAYVLTSHCQQVCFLRLFWGALLRVHLRFRVARDWMRRKTRARPRSYIQSVSRGLKSSRAVVSIARTTAGSQLREGAKRSCHSAR